ncbi:MAG TPA: TadE family type IV pilus minor pilin [Nocardioidaceae bacterium]|nr:TadE family type IV pilus minor pilin [Nocardioidaceae bacterium]
MSLPSAARPRRGERGAVTAETMVVLPLLAAVALGLVWLLALAAAQMRVVDAAREVARAAARDDAPTSAIALGRRVAPDGAQIRVHDHGATVTADVVAAVRGPGGLFDFLPEIDVTASAVAAQEAR